jgi:tetratricopeptide (TPR) repeat protein
MLYRRLWWISGLLLLFAIPLPAQWRPGVSPGGSFGRAGICRNIEVIVRDSMGITIAGAKVTMNDNVVPFTTDSQGLAVIPYCATRDTVEMMEVRASGYLPAKVMIMSGLRSRFEVSLERHDPFPKSSALTVNVNELYPEVQKKSRNFLELANKALNDKDYGSAKKLLLNALKLTPSNGAIPNNLGIVALHQNNLNAAVSWLQDATDIAPYAADIVENLGIVRWIQQRRDESYRLLCKAADMGYVTGAGLYIIGKVSLEKGLDKEAAKYLKDTPRDQFPYRDLYLSTALRHLGKTKTADKAYRDFLKHNPFPFALGIPQN